MLPLVYVLLSVLQERLETMGVGAIQKQKIIIIIIIILIVIIIFYLRFCRLLGVEAVTADDDVDGVDSSLK